MANSEKRSSDFKAPMPVNSDDIVDLGNGTIINASGHVQELERNFNFASILAVGIVTGASWPAIGGSIVIALYNGGPPGVIYEFIVVSLFYFCIAASLAELASAIPSSAGVYHWASVTSGPKYSRAVGFFAGWWNLFAWIFGSASMANIQGNIIVSLWALFHPDYVFQRWHVFVVYVIQTWVCCGTVMFANRALPWVSNAGMFFIIAGVFITILVCAIMPHTTGSGYATSAAVWIDWDNQTGYSSDGFVFFAGMLNGAYAIGTPDCVSHLAEEIPNPKRNVPYAMLVQLVVGFVTAFLYLIAIFYAVNNLDDVTSSSFEFPLAAVYQQATNSSGGALGLLLLVLFPTVCTCIGTYLTNSRVLWTLARDGATPLPNVLGKISPRWKSPLAAAFTNGCVVTLLGCIYVGSSYAFSAFVGSFVIMSTLSYLAAILPHLLTRRQHVKPGPFWIKGPLGMVVHAGSSAYIIVFIVIFLFPYALPVDAQSMNYSVAITGGLTLLVVFWWFWSARKGYQGPRDQILEIMHGGTRAIVDMEHTAKS